LTLRNRHLNAILQLLSPWPDGRFNIRDCNSASLLIWYYF
jgi:hypothetical protein